MFDNNLVAIRESKVSLKLNKLFFSNVFYSFLKNFIQNKALT